MTLKPISYLPNPAIIFPFWKLRLDSEGGGEITIPDFDLLEYVVLNPVVQSWYADSVHYDYSADLTPWPDYEVAVDYIEPVEIYSNASRTMQFEIINLGSKGGLYFMSVSDDLGWDIELLDSFQYLAVRDTVFVAAELQSGEGLVPGTMNNIYLTSTLSTDTAVHSTGGLTGRDRPAATGIPIMMVRLMSRTPYTLSTLFSPVVMNRFRNYMPGMPTAMIR